MSKPDIKARITINNLSWAYQAGDPTSQILSDINLSMNTSETVALLGQSGSGKSSLLNLIAGIEPIQKGRIHIDQHALEDMDEHQRTLFRRQAIGVVYQFFNLISTLTVSENLALVLELNKTPRKTIAQRVYTQLQGLGLEHKANVFPDQLSGGEQQRVAIGRALIHQPSLILADEPTGNLDAKNGQRVLELLIQQAQQNQASLLLVTHSHAVAERADRIITLDDGKLHQTSRSLAW